MDSHGILDEVPIQSPLSTGLSQTPMVHESLMMDRVPYTTAISQVWHLFKLSLGPMGGSQRANFYSKLPFNGVLICSQNRDINERLLSSWDIII